MTRTWYNLTGVYPGERGQVRVGCPDYYLQPLHFCFSFMSDAQCHTVLVGQEQWPGQLKAHINKWL